MSMKPVAEDIPTSVAWIDGRRIYVRSEYGSPFANRLYEAGATWDGEAKARWVGTTKRDAILALVREHLADLAVEQAAKEQRRAAVEEIKAAGHWVRIPYEASDIRETAKALGGVWDSTRKQWAMPTEAALADVAAAVVEHHAQAAAAKELAEKSTAADIVARSGRTPIGDVERVGTVSREWFNRSSAAAAGHQVGDVVRLKGGRRGVVTAVEIWFVDEAMGSSCWHNSTMDNAHWHWLYEVVPVELTAHERAADEEKAAARAAFAADLTEIEALYAALKEAPLTPAGEQWQFTPGVSGPKVTKWGGSSDSFRDGVLVLVGERVVWQHGGYYDEYRHSERAVDDPQIVARLRAVFAGGPRRVGAYEVGAA